MIVIYGDEGGMGYKPAVGTILETNRERDTRCKLTMELGLGSACTDRAPGDHW